MSVTVQELLSGDTDYIGKHNANYTALANAVNALLASAGASASFAIPTALAALLGDDLAVVGASSYLCEADGTDLTVQPGFAWLPLPTGTVVSLAAEATLPFVGLPADTYYVIVDALGTPTRTDVSTDALYSIVWDGSAFGTITRLAAVTWGASDWLAAQSSAALAASYVSPDARFEAIEERLNVEPFDLFSFVPGLPDDGGTALAAIMVRDCVFEAGLPGSYAKAEVASDATAVFNITKNGSPVGTITFSTSATGVLAAASDIELVAGDVLKVVAPSPQNATLSGFHCGLKGIRL